MMVHSLCSTNCGPSLAMVIAPENKTRFRYESEGGSHGGLTGKEKINGKKTYPTVMLSKYSGSYKNIFIRVSLYTENKTEHVLKFKKKKSSENQNYIDEDLKEDFTAEFKNLTILSKKKEEIYQALMDRRVSSLGRNLSRFQRNKFESENSEAVKKEAREILNSVILRFDAFERPDVLICPALYSEPICNQKASSKGDLRIHRMSKCSGSWNGGEDVILLCDKVQKDNIKILFYEADVEDGWKEYASFKPCDVHYQVAIPFKTPKYKENVEKTVAVALERQGEFSEALLFTYIPEDCPSKKRKKCVLDILPTPMSVSSCGSGSNTAAVSDDSSQEMMMFSENSYKIETLHNEQNSNVCDIPSNELGLLTAEWGNIFDAFPNILDGCFDNADGSPDLVVNQSLDFEGLFSLSEEGVEMDIGLPLAEAMLPVAQMGIIRGGGLAKLPEAQLAIEQPMREMRIKQAVGEAMLPVGQMGSPSDFPSLSYFSNLENKKLAIITEKLGKYLHLRDENGNTLLHYAVLNNKSIGIIKYVKQIAEYDIINIQNCNKHTPLHIALEKNANAVRPLLLYGGNPNIKNAEGNNCFHIASLNNLDECMMHLFTYSSFQPKINEFNYEGLSPLHAAIMNKSSACFYILLSRKADLSVQERKCGRSLLHYAVEFQPSLVLPILEEDAIDVNIQDFEGNTPLHIACGNSDYNTVKQLLLADADPSVRNFKPSLLDSEEEDSNKTLAGQTPADLTEDSKILELLKQASMKDTSSGFSASTGDSETAEELLKNLCNALDPNKRWKSVATYVLDEKFLHILECSPSPTSDLLKYMKKNLGEGYIETFKATLEMIGFNDAAQIIEESKSPLIEL